MFFEAVRLMVIYCFTFLGLIETKFTIGLHFDYFGFFKRPVTYNNDLSLALTYVSI